MTTGTFNSALPKLQKTPRWAPVVDGRPNVAMGLFRRRGDAIVSARSDLAPRDHHRAGAVRVRVAFA